MDREESAHVVIAGRDAYSARGDITIVHNNASEYFRPPFLTVNQEFIKEEKRKPRVPYIARPPQWADVVHGQNRESRFLEREQLGSLLSSIERKLLEPLRAGTDRRLNTLFVTGAPGCGKSTLVRHAAALLVERGDVVVADLGVNHGRLAVEDLEAYVRGLAQLSQAGMPVLLLMDDPFFAGSGWDRLLERLAQPNNSGVAVLGASPTYLFEAYGRPLSGRQVVLSTFPLGVTTRTERSALVEMYGVRATPGMDRAVQRREDLLVFAMETASGNSFSEIIARIWSTLNDGVAISPKSGTTDVEWPVLAFLLTSYMHRYYVMCPESLLRAYLTILAGNVRTDFIRELSDLTLSEGWHIFRLSDRDSRTSRSAMIGTMHARVAERAWRLRPFRSIDHAAVLAQASAQVPDCAPQLAEFMLACQPLSSPWELGVVQRVAEQWRDNGVTTADLGRLVHGLNGSPVALPFRGALRERLRHRDSQSWLAAVELIALEGRGSAERDRLSRVELPYCLKLADLSAGSALAIGLLGREGSQSRPGFVDRLCASLEGKLGWELDSTLLIWLMRNQDASQVLSHLPLIYDWLDTHPEAERVRVALLNWHTDHVSMIGDHETDLILDRTREWLSVLPDGQELFSRFFALVSALLDNGTPADALVGEVSSWANSDFSNSYLRDGFLRLVIRHASLVPQIADDTMTGAVEWLTTHPEENELRRTLLWLVLAAPDLPAAGPLITDAIAWFIAHPTDNAIRDSWVSLLPAVPLATLSEATRSILGLLADHQPELGVRLALHLFARTLTCHRQAAEVISQTSAWISRHPEDRRIRIGFLNLMRELPGHPQAAAVITEARRWVFSHPKDADLRGSFHALSLSQPGSVDPAAAIPDMLNWLTDHKDDVEGHLILLTLARAIPSAPETAEVIDETIRWLSGPHDNSEPWLGLFGLLSTVPGNPKAAETVTCARQWLMAHPDDVQVRMNLLNLVRSLPGHPQAIDVIDETREWLGSHPDDGTIRVGLRGLILDVQGDLSPLDSLIGERAWAQDRPDDSYARIRLLSMAQELAHRPEAREIITETRHWLDSHPDNLKVRVALWELIRSVTGQPEADEAITEARQWLADRPDDTYIRAALLNFIRTLPGHPQASPMISETEDWLGRHSDRLGRVNAQLKRLVRAINGPPAYAGGQPRRTPQDLAEARAWLADHPEEPRAHAQLLEVVRRTHDFAHAAEVIKEARHWLADQPDDYLTWTRLLALVREAPDGVDVVEVLLEARLWLLDHPDYDPMRANMLALVRVLPAYGETAEVVEETLDWLALRPEVTNLRLTLLSLVRTLPDHPLAEEVSRDARRYLACNPAENRIREGLIALAGTTPENTAAEEILQEARSWLAVHPQESHLRASLIGLAETLTAAAAQEDLAESRSSTDDGQDRDDDETPLLPL